MSSNNSEKDCAKLLKNFSECIEKRKCSSQLKDYIRCEQQSLRLRWQKKNKATDPNSKRRRVTLKHYDNFGTIVNEPIELRKQEEKRSVKQQEPHKQRQTENKKGSSSYQQRWGTYEPMNEGLPLIEFWKSYWNNSRRLLTLMFDGKYLEKTEKFGKKMYRHMEKEWDFLNETWRTWTNSWRKGQG